MKDKVLFGLFWLSCTIVGFSLIYSGYNKSNTNTDISNLQIVRLCGLQNSYVAQYILQDAKGNYWYSRYSDKISLILIPLKSSPNTDLDSFCNHPL